MALIYNVLVSSIPPRTDDVIRQQRVEELNTILQDVSAKVGVKFISIDKSFRLADGQPTDGYLCKDGLHPNSRGTSRLIDNLRLAKQLAEDSKPDGNNEGNAISSKRKRAPVLSRQRRHDNDSGNTTNSTINDGRDDDDLDPIGLQPTSPVGRHFGYGVDPWAKLACISGLFTVYEVGPNWAQTKKPIWAPLWISCGSVG